ncbi:MAG: PAS domain-containing protein [Gemmatimonadaceae bacterium]|nr:PAS domain-containing protein [Gemmatimonadaceae bacterium]
MLQTAVGGGPLGDVLTRVAEWVERASPGSLCSVLLLDERRSRVRHAAAPSLPRAYVRLIDGLEIGPRNGSCGAAAYTGNPVIVADVETDPLWENYRALIAPFNLRACWSHPIVGGNGAVLGTFAVYRREPATPSDDEWELLVDASHITALLIERSRAEQARVEHERNLRSIVDNALDYIMRLDADGRFTYINPAALARMGRTWEQVIGRRFRDLGYSPHIADALTAHFDEVTRTRAPLRIELALPVPDRDIWFDAVFAPIIDEAGTLTAVVLIARDVTERHLSQEALRRSEERLRLLFARSERSIALLDVEGRVREVGDHATLSTNIARDLILGVHFWELPAVAATADTQAALRRAIRDAAHGQTTSGNITYRGAAGEHRHGWFQVHPVHDAEGRVAELLLEGSDVTAMRELEVRLRQSEKMESLGRLAGGIAHDFNNILAAILGYGELLLHDAVPGTVSHEGLHHIVASSRRARDLVRQILTFSRKAEIAHQPVNLAAVVADGLRLLRASLPSTIELQEKLPERSLVVMGDGSQLSQVILNLGANAEYELRKAKAGTLHVSLDLQLFNDAQASAFGVHAGPYARLVVRDSGGGIPADVLPKIFEPFFTTKPLGEGTGMGLAVVHGIVVAHGGGVRVSSSAAGTTFDLVFPVVTTPADAPTQRPDSTAHGSGCVLVVDDEVAIVNLLRRILPRRGFEVVCMTSPVDAVEAFRADPQRFDLVVTDRTMPRMTGEALADAVHRLRPDLPIVITSGQGCSADEEDREGRTVFLAKPFDAGDLMAAIERARRRVAR